MAYHKYHAHIGSELNKHAFFNAHWWLILLLLSVVVVARSTPPQAKPLRLASSTYTQDRRSHSCSLEQALTLFEEHWLLELVLSGVVEAVLSTTPQVKPWSLAGLHSRLNFVMPALRGPKRGLVTSCFTVLQAVSGAHPLLWDTFSSAIWSSYWSIDSGIWRPENTFGMPPSNTKQNAPIVTNSIKR